MVYVLRNDEIVTIPLSLLVPIGWGMATSRSVYNRLSLKMDSLKQLVSLRECALVWKLHECNEGSLWHTRRCKYGYDSLLRYPIAERSCG